MVTHLKKSWARLAIVSLCLASGLVAVAPAAEAHECVSGNPEADCGPCTPGQNHDHTVPEHNPHDERDCHSRAACNDGNDNDGDGRVDAADPGCANRDDNDERNATPPSGCRDIAIVTVGPLPAVVNVDVLRRLGDIAVVGPTLPRLGTPDIGTTLPRLAALDVVGGTALPRLGGSDVAVAGLAGLRALDHVAIVHGPVVALRCLDTLIAVR